MREGQKRANGLLDAHLTTSQAGNTGSLEEVSCSSVAA